MYGPLLERLAAEYVYLSLCVSGAVSGVDVTPGPKQLCVCVCVFT